MNQPAESSKNNVAEMGIKFGPITLMPDIEKRHLFTLFFGAFFGIASMALVNVFGPLVFDILEIPQNETGALAGKLTAMQEIVVVCVIGLAGAFSDKVGRRIVYSMGFVLLLPCHSKERSPPCDCNTKCTSPPEFLAVQQIRVPKKIWDAKNST